MEHGDQTRLPGPVPLQSPLSAHSFIRLLTAPHPQARCFPGPWDAFLLLQPVPWPSSLGGAVKPASPQARPEASGPSGALAHRLSRGAASIGFALACVLIELVSLPFDRVPLALGRALQDHGSGVLGRTLLCFVCDGLGCVPGLWPLDASSTPHTVAAGCLRTLPPVPRAGSLRGESHCAGLAGAPCRRAGLRGRSSPSAPGSRAAPGPADAQQ